MRIGLTANPNKRLALDLARRAIERIGDRAEVLLSDETRAALGLTRPSAPLEGLEADLMIVIGGDGTILHALQRTRVPVLAMNAGTVGFLAEIEGSSPPAFDGAIERALSGAYHVDERMKLASRVGDRQLPDATNEIVVHTSQVAKMRLFEILIDGRAVGRIRSDGIIVATPTGSTSYALSALGPIVDPGVEAIVVAALAPFQATQRAVVVEPLRTVGVRLVHPDKDGVVVIDGQDESPAPSGSVVTTYRSPRRARFVRFGGRFFRRLRGKKILPWTEEPEPSEESDDDGVPPPA
ncbi:MAG TPA: NAD(+)/NADH kinase [Thermoplasmata archaeon]|nr:NAD(+)/NADH kinase [Thermoplasmata archaeon]